MPTAPDLRRFRTILYLASTFLLAWLSTAHADEKALDPGKIEETLRRIDESFPKPTRYGYPRYAPMYGLKSKAGQPTTSEAPYFLIPGQTRETSAEQLPLRSTRADISIAGVIAQVRVQQIYQNRGAKPIEATYLFPASTRAAVHGMRMQIGKRIVEAKIQGREEARQTYETAKAQGYRTSLLEQQRPNVFSMNVANLMPGEEIKVQLDYSELLVPESGVYELIYPTVVGPRYTGGMNTAKETWVANPYLKKGAAVPYTFGLDIRLESPIGIKEITSPSHQVQTSYDSPERAKIHLPEGGEGNRDFVLRYRLAGDKIESGIMVYEGQKENFFLAMMEPPQRVKPKSIPDREYIFVLDVSCSMYGFPLSTAKTLLKDLFRVLRPKDTFNIVLFSGTAHVMSPRSMPVDDASLTKAHHVIDRVRSGGGTELLGALRLAYAIPKDPQRSRNVVLITDGYIGVEAETFRFVRKNLDKANLFSFGIGSSVNRGLIEGVARAGMGEPFVVLNPSQVSSVTEKLRKYIQSPVLTAIRADLEGVQSYDMVPRNLPDLMASRPLVLFGKFKGSPQGSLRIAGYTGEGKWSQTLPLRPAKVNRLMSPLRYLWARSWVDILMDQFALLPGNKELESVITQVGLHYNLLTQFTSFVAVDSEQVNPSGSMDKVKQPLPLPQGVSNRAVAAPTAAPSGNLQGTSSGHAFGSSGLGIRGGSYGGGGGYGKGSYASPSVAYRPAPKPMRSYPKREAQSYRRSAADADAPSAKSSPPPLAMPSTPPPAEPSASPKTVEKSADPAPQTESRPPKKWRSLKKRRSIKRGPPLSSFRSRNAALPFPLRLLFRKFLEEGCGVSSTRFASGSDSLRVVFRIDGTFTIEGVEKAQADCLRRKILLHIHRFKRPETYKDPTKELSIYID